MSSNLVVRDLRVQKSPQFHVKFDGCSHVFIENLSINSPALSPNTDGIHIENTKSVFISNCVISNGNEPSLPHAAMLLINVFKLLINVRNHTLLNMI